MQKKSNSAEKGLTTKRIVLILGAVVIICAAVIVAIILLKPASDGLKTIESNGAKVVDENNLSSLGDEMQEKVQKGMFETHMNTTWKFPDGKSPSSNAVMGNSAANTYAFWFTVLLKDTKEVVYESSLMPVGTELEKIVLSRDLDKGTYDAVVAIHMVDEKGEETVNNMGINVTLIVEK